LGVAAFGSDWAGAWDHLRGQLVDALNTIREEVLNLFGQLVGDLSRPERRHHMQVVGGPLAAGHGRIERGRERVLIRVYPGVGHQDPSVCGSHTDA